MSRKDYNKVLILLTTLFAGLFLANHSFGQCIYSISPTEIVLPGNGGADYIYLSTGGCESYEAYSNDGWLYVWTDYYEQIVTVYADANHEGYRQGTVIIHDYWTETDYYVTVSQDLGCEQLPAPGTIYGPSSVCCGSPASFYIDPVEGATSYAWYVDGNSVPGYYGTSTVITTGCGASQVIISVCGYNECGNGLLSTKEITVNFSPSGGTISESQTICYNTAPASLNNVTSASGGVPPYNYQWQSSTDGGLTWNNIPGATSTTYSPPALTIPTKYRRTVTDANGCMPGVSNILTINIYSTTLNGGIISGDNTSYGGYSGPITSLQDASGGSGIYSYAWEKSENGETSWIYTGCSSKDYPSSPQNVTMYYRRKVTDNLCGYTSYSNIVFKQYITSVIYLSEIPDPETRELNTNLLVGSTKGVLNVDAAGGTSYNINIELPEGVNGLAPSLSLVYSSHNGPGIAGYGWNISGISSIKRGPQNFYNDGVARGIELDNNDRFYLDGQRLINTSSNYGDPSAQYQTELDIFTRVTPQNNDGNGPGWFRAETKNGLIYEYGNSQESKQKINGFSQTIEWYVSKISDFFGNHIDFNYLKDNGSIYPAEIIYGPNRIKFYYKSRIDVSDSYFKGVKTRQGLLLDKIIIQYNSASVKTYEFKYSYQGSDYNSYSLLNEVIEYGTGSNRLNSTAFSYSIPANVSFQQTLYNAAHQYVTYKSKLVAGDFNGDGKSDFLCLPDPSKGASWNGMKVFNSNGNDNFYILFSCQLNLNLDSLYDIRSCDINADGIDDLIYEYKKDNVYSNCYFTICNGYSFSQPHLFATIPTTTYSGLTGKKRRIVMKQEDDNEKKGKFSFSIFSDYNGDGVNDIFIYTYDGLWWLGSLVNTSGILTSEFNILGFGFNNDLTGDVLSGDFNGDNKTDIWVFHQNGLKIYTFTESSLILLYNNDWPTDKHFFNLGDFNGDGKCDLFVYGYGSDDWATWRIRLSTGAGFETIYIPQKKANLKDDHVRVGDFNGDGFTDIMASCLANNNTYFYLSKNKGTNLYTSIIQCYPFASHNYYVADFNGDGKTDFICTDGAEEWWNGYKVYRTSGNSSILIDKISNGLGVLTKINYARLSEYGQNVYQKGSGAVFPVTDFQGPWSVVSSILTDNGKGSLNTQKLLLRRGKDTSSGERISRLR